MEKWKEGFEKLKSIKLKSKASVLIFPILIIVLPYVKLELQRNGNLEAALFVQRIVFAILGVFLYLLIRLDKNNKEIFKNKYSEIIFLMIALVILLPIIIL